MNARPGFVEAQGARDAALEFLLRRMRNRSDFPALAATMARIQRLTESDSENLHALASQILQDVALTHKLLRLVNTAQFRHAGGGTIGTVSRAVALIGFRGVRDLALSLLLLEHMDDARHAERMKDAFLHALLAAQLAAGLAEARRDVEEAYLGAMLQNLGDLLAEYYFPDEAMQIRAMVDTGEGAPTREAAALRVLGIGLQDLGLGVARAWDLPESLQHAMRTPDGTVPTRAIQDPGEWLRWLGHAANAGAAQLLCAASASTDGQLHAVGQAHAAALGVPAARFVETARAVRTSMPAIADALGLKLPTTTSAGAPAPAGEGTAPVPGQGAAELLLAGVQDIAETLSAEDVGLNHVLRMVLETLYRALDLRRVVLCLRDPRTDLLTARFGLGAFDDALRGAFRVQVAADPNDLLATVCQHGVDTLLDDAAAPDVSGCLPEWHRRVCGGASLLLLPMTMKQRTFALIYGDRAPARSIVLGDRERSLLRTLRNQALAAFRHARH